MKRTATVMILSLVAVGSAQSLTIYSPIPDPSIASSEFRTNPRYQNGKSTCERGPLTICLAYHLMYLQCGAILVEKSAPTVDELPAWHAYSMHSGPKVPFIRAAYSLPEFFDPSLPAKRGSGMEFDPLRKVDFRGNLEVFHPLLENPNNRRLALFVRSTIDWLDSQESTIVDACELQSFWKELRAESFPPMEENVVAEDE